MKQIRIYIIPNLQIHSSEIIFRCVFTRGIFYQLPKDASITFKRGKDVIPHCVLHKNHLDLVLSVSTSPSLSFCRFLALLWWCLMILSVEYSHENGVSPPLYNRCHTMLYNMTGILPTSNKHFRIISHPFI